MAPQYEHYLMRMPADLKGRLAEQAERTGRSMNAELTLALEAWLAREGGVLGECGGECLQCDRGVADAPRRRSDD